MDDVVVVGAGPTGLTAGIELARRGVRVRVLDAATAPFPGSRGKGLQPRSLELLDALGVADRLVSLGRFDLPMRHHAPDGTHRDVHLHGQAEPERGLPWARTLMLPQWRVEQVLRERLAEEGVTVEQDARVVDLEQDDDGVRLHLADGSVIPGRYAVGADGGSSTVRQRLDVAFLGETREEVRMLLADVEVDGPDRDHWHVWGEGAGFVALCPLPGTATWQLQAADPGPGRSPTEDVLRGIVDGLGPRVRLRQVHWASAWRLNERLVERYRVGRVLLAGDAAHVHSPAGGQGMNTGIADAVNLGWKLAAVLGGADAALLDTYEAERLPVAADVLGLSSRLLTTPFTRRADTASDTSQLGVTYRGGPLAESTRDTGGPGPGDRAPDAPTREGDLLTLRRGADWTLLVVDAEPPVLDERVRVVHAEPAARELYALRDGEMVLVRPDGHVGCRSRDADALRAWLAPLLPVRPTAHTTPGPTG